MRYMMFIKHKEDYRNIPAPPGLMEAMGKFVEASFKNGTLVDTGGLKGTAEGAKVRLSKGKISVTDGPFTESKEIVGGYALVEAQSKEHAKQIARQFMELHQKHWPEFDGECEVRPLEAMPERS